MSADSEIPAVCPEKRAVFARLNDGEGVIVDTDAASYFGLNRTAAFLWEKLQETGAVTAAKLAEQLCERFEVQPADAQRDVERFLDQVVDFGLARCDRTGLVAGKDTEVRLEQHT